MKTITLVPNNKGLIDYELSTDTSTDDMKRFKYDHHYLFVACIHEVMTTRKRKTIFVDDLPKLSDSLNDLKAFMNTVRFQSVLDWNQRREEAKAFFTFQVIDELDGSGYIKKLDLHS